MPPASALAHRFDVCTGARRVCGICSGIRQAAVFLRLRQYATSTCACIRRAAGAFLRDEVSLGGAPVLRSVDLEIRQGDFLAVVGPNAAGKPADSVFYSALSRSERVGDPLWSTAEQTSAAWKWQCAGDTLSESGWRFVADGVCGELRTA